MYDFCPWAANIPLNFTSLSNLALNMEHSVCKVSSAHLTKEWLSALFEALDGLELSVNNYCISPPYFGLPVATNAFPITSTSVLLQVPSTSQLAMVHRTEEQEMVVQSGVTWDTFLPSHCVYLVCISRGRPVSSLDFCLLDCGTDFRRLPENWDELLKLSGTSCKVDAVTPGQDKKSWRG